MNDRIRKIFILFSVISISCVACTELNVRKLDPTDSAWEERKGIAYSLQFHQFKIDVTRGIASCETKAAQIPMPNPPPAPTFPEVKAFVKAEITSELVDDGHHTYVIDANSLRGMTKITSIVVEWKDGRLVGFNASADDQTGEVIASVAAGVTKLATTVIQPLSVIAASSVDPAVKQYKFVKCKDDIRDSVSRFQTNSKVVEQKTKELTKISDKLDDEQARLRRLGDSSSTDCSKASNSAHPRCVLEQLLIDQKATESALKKAKKNMESELAKISYKETYRWPENSIASISDIKSIKSSKLNKWLEEHSQGFTSDPGIPKRLTSLANFKTEFDLAFRIGKIGSFGKETAENVPEVAGQPVRNDPNNSKDGIRYRIPAKGYIAVCRGLSKDDVAAKCHRDADKKVLVAKLNGSMQQLGYIFHIPFESKAFTKGNMELKFDSEGRLEKASMAQEESSAQNISKAFEGLVGEYAKYKAAEAAAEGTELSKLQEQTALLVAEKEFMDAQRALDPEVLPLTELQNMIALAEAQKKYMDALAALEPEEPPSANEEELAIVNSEVLLLLAEIARLEALLRRTELEKVLDP